jgi:hypothetical protein
MRPAVQRQAENPRGLFARREKQAVAAKIVEPDGFAAEPIKQPNEPGLCHQLAGQQVVALEARIVARVAGPVDGAERKESPLAAEGGKRAWGR